MNVNKIHTSGTILLAIAILFAVIPACNKAENKKTQSETIEKKIDALIDQMTLDEKIGQMTQIRHFDAYTEEDIINGRVGSIIHTDGPVPGETAAEWQAKFNKLQNLALQSRLKIPMLFGVDAVHGQNTFNGATIFPHNISMGAARNPELVKKAAEITALETRATGLNWTFSPCITISYNEKWGRVYEGYSESTELTNTLTKASVEGHQGSLNNPVHVLATVKHYVGDGSTDFGVEGGSTTLSVEEINERLLPPYREAVKAGVGAVMVGFNDLDGISMHAHKPLITDTLKKGMHFDGIVLTDWKGYSRFGRNKIINAGVDMVMAVDGDMNNFQQGLKEGISSGEVSIERINDAVRRILRQKLRLNLFENPMADSELVATIGQQSHRDVARQAVRESLVLLKNNDQALPINPDLENIVVVGKHANNTGLQSGGWTIRWQGVKKNYNGATTILEGIQELAQGNVIYDSIGVEEHPDADIAIIVVGEDPYAEFFGDIGDERGSCSYYLRESHQQYIDHYTNQGIKVVTVLISGRPLIVTDQINKSDAFVAAWLPGSEGEGVAEVLFGKFNFKGKLPHSWPTSEDDFKGKFGPNFWDKSKKPLFEYGFGLQYKKAS